MLFALDLPAKPRLAEYLIAAFAALAVVANVSSFWNGEYLWPGGDPYAKYHSNMGIRAVEVTALLVNTLLLLTVVRWRITFAPSRLWIGGLVAAAALLPWMELWWGSTFYYGEIRDKQGLPMGVTNGGTIGTLMFLSYVITRWRTPVESRWQRVILRLVVVILVCITEASLVVVLEEPWNLTQS